jgi:hypothetical protein
MTLLDRYYWLLAHTFCIFGTMFRIWSVFLGIWVLSDILRFTHFGYPAWAIVFCAAFFAFGYFVSRAARFWLRRQNERLKNSK